MADDDKPLHELLADAPDETPVSDDPLVVRLASIVARQQAEIEQLRAILTSAGIEVEDTADGLLIWRTV